MLFIMIISIQHLKGQTIYVKQDAANTYDTGSLRDDRMI